MNNVEKYWAVLYIDPNGNEKIPSIMIDGRSYLALAIFGNEHVAELEKKRMESAYAVKINLEVAEVKIKRVKKDKK